MKDGSGLDWETIFSDHNDCQLLFFLQYDCSSLVLPPSVARVINCALSNFGHLRSESRFLAVPEARLQDGLLPFTSRSKWGTRGEHQRLVVACAGRESSEAADRGDAWFGCQ